MPYLLFYVPAGALLDRLDRKRVMLWCEGVRVLALGSVPVALWLGRLTYVQLLVAGFVGGTCYVFFSVAEKSVLPALVRPEQLTPALAQQEAKSRGTGLVGPPLGGPAVRRSARAALRRRRPLLRRLLPDGLRHPRRSSGTAHRAGRAAVTGGGGRGGLAGGPTVHPGHRGVRGAHQRHVPGADTKGCCTRLSAGRSERVTGSSAHDARARLCMWATAWTA
ncbi:hypothetical protein ACGFZB_25025 [Streptomyces cinerochromogenes]|uniref:Major facilitator superfamily (MFS) profile domain-containing protein n=1 Tax=Streptomyces cinerochromogenes TaxID=66422 RepID=A0ABW7BD85_9ACTN